MASGENNRRRIQFSLSAIMLFVAAFSLSLALIKSEYLDLAMDLVLPFAIGVAVGQCAIHRAEPLVAPTVAAAIVPVLSLAIDTTMNKSELVTMPAFGLLSYCLMLFPVILIFGGIPALLGSLLGYWLQVPSLDHTT